MSGHCAMCGSFHEEEDGRLCAACNRGWHATCHVVCDNTDFDSEGDISWWAVRSQDQQFYLDENDLKWKPCPQVMGGWFMSRRLAYNALKTAPCPPGVEPTEDDWRSAGEVES